MPNSVAKQSLLANLLQYWPHLGNVNLRGSRINHTWNMGDHDQLSARQDSTQTSNAGLLLLEIEGKGFKNLIHCNRCVQV